MNYRIDKYLEIIAGAICIFVFIYILATTNFNQLDAKSAGLLVTGIIAFPVGIWSVYRGWLGFKDSK